MSMELPENAEKLKIHIGESDKYKGRPLYEAIVKEARKVGLAGATVTRGVMGYGANSRVRTSKILRLSEGLPLIIELVDSVEKIEKLIPYLDEMISEGLVTREKVRVIFYRHNSCNLD